MDDPVVNAAVIDAVSRAASEIRAKDLPRVETLDEPGILDAAIAAGEDEEETTDLVFLSGVPQADTIDIAREFPDTVYIGVGQGFPCVTEEGFPDPTETCLGDSGSLVRNYASSDFRIDQAGYLAGIMAASVSRNGRIGAIGGWPGCYDCNRYIQSFQLGVESVSPTTEVLVAYLTDDDPEVANHDIETGRAFAEAFIAVNELDIVLAATGGSSPGVIQAACTAGILAIGTDVDRALEHPRTSGCVLTSAMRDYDAAITQEIFKAAEAARDPDVVYIGGGTTWDLSNGGVGLAPSYSLTQTLPVELSTRLEEATDAILNEHVQTCLEACRLSTSSEDVAAGSDASPAAPASGAPEEASS
jgi:basic membrane protein A